jgi:hypothetical protein
MAEQHLESLAALLDWAIETTGAVAVAPGDKGAPLVPDLNGEEFVWTAADTEGPPSVILDAIAGGRAVSASDMRAFVEKVLASLDA